MFNENQIAAYQNIKAPDGLQQKIMNRTKKINKSLYFISAVAACFIFIISGGIISANQDNIVINGQKLVNSIVFYDTASSYGRTVPHSISVPVEINISRNTKISVSDGFISIDGSYQKKEISITSDSTIWWEIELKDSKNIYEMKISDKKGVKLVTLKYDNAKITVSKEKEK